MTERLNVTIIFDACCYTVDLHNVDWQSIKDFVSYSFREHLFRDARVIDYTTGVLLKIFCPSEKAAKEMQCFYDGPYRWELLV